MHSAQVELQGKCRRLFYLKVDGPVPTDDDGTPLPDEQPKAGMIVGVSSGGGALEDLTGNDLIIATYNDDTAPERIGCIEEFYSPVPAARPLRIDLTKVQSCCDAIDNHRAAQQAEADFVFETGIKLFGSESPTTADLRHTLKVQEMYTRDNPSRTSDHGAIVQAQTDLEALCKTCEDCCEQLLVTRDAAITFAESAS
jgi:hypothetical protein